MIKYSLIIPNDADIIYQLIEGEYILLNLKNGNYFSLDNLGVLAWESVREGVDPQFFIQEISPEITERKDEIMSSFVKLFDDLIVEGLAIHKEIASLTPPEIPAVVREMLVTGYFSCAPVYLHAYKNIQEKYAHPCGIKEKE